MLVSSVVLIIFAEISLNSLSSTGVPTPSFLWAVVNSSLSEKKAPRHCAKVIFFNNRTLGDPLVAENQRGIVQNSFINIEDSIFHHDYQQWENAEQNVRDGTKKSIEAKLDPCVTVVSFVLNSTQYNLTALDRRRFMNHYMADLLQHSTPIVRRHLVLIRISKSLDDFRFCTKASKYPIRLVPDWEMLLFDFFTDVRVIQGFFYENGEESHPYVRISKENGRWKWLCEDIITNLDIERSCNYNLDQKCLDANPDLQIWKPGVEPRTCKKGFRPRQ